MVDELKAAAVAGLVLGVKWAVVVLVVGVALFALMGDYAITRNNAHYAASVIRESVAKQQMEAPK